MQIREFFGSRKAPIFFVAKHNYGNEASALPWV